MLIRAIISIGKYLVLKCFYLIFVLYPFVTGGLPSNWELEIFLVSTLAVIIIAFIWLDDDLEKLGMKVSSFFGRN